MTPAQHGSPERFDPAVTQFKFEAFSSLSRNLEKMFALFELLEIVCEESREEDIRDQYYDDNERTLARNECIIRQRLQPDGTQLLTFLASKKHAASIGAERMKVEMSCDAGALDAMLQNGFRSEIARIFRDKFRVQLNCKQLVSAVAVHNHRTIIPFATAVGRYVLHFDTFCFRNQDVTSDDHNEIEIACETPFAVQDAQMQKLLKALQELLDFQPHKKSKFRRAIEWSRSKGQDIRTVHCVMFDIVGYSKRTSDMQKQSILTFNKFVQQAIIEVGAYDPEDIIFIPTGDGLILVVENNPQFLVRLIFDLQDRVKGYSELDPDRAFLFRTGLHSGPVFKYLDINEKPNYAGNGINLAQRVMNVGDGCHILSTKEAFENIAGMDAGAKDYFHELPADAAVKHGGILKVYNIFDSDGHGNALPPVLGP